ncbi:MAG: hypothetical protein JKX97_02645 [Candidatus Lindowbacteria bacterium]|nr:hypothetical protein [Candidatus Lindowbacteria bacterium]
MNTMAEQEFHLSNGTDQYGPYDRNAIAAWMPTRDTTQSWWIWDGNEWADLELWFTQNSNLISQSASEIESEIELSDEGTIPSALSSIFPKIRKYSI